MNQQERKQLIEMIIGLIILIVVGLGVIALIFHLEDESNNSTIDEIGLGETCEQHFVQGNPSGNVLEVSTTDGYDGWLVDSAKFFFNGEEQSADAEEAVTYEFDRDAPNMLRARLWIRTAQPDIATGEPIEAVYDCNLSYTYE